MQLRSCIFTLLIVLLTASFASAEWTLIHHYKLDETTGTTATDSVGSDDGTLTVASGSAGFSFDDDAITGQIDGALNFTRSDHHMIALEDDTLALGTVDFKISMWVKRSAADIGTRQGLVAQYSTETLNDHSMWARFDNSTGNVDKLLFLVDTGGSDERVFSNTVLTDTTSWHQLEFVRTYSAVDDETTYAIYIDGSLDNSAVYAGTPYPISAVNGAMLGNYTPTNNNSFGGGMDDVRVYTQAVPEPSTIVLLALGLLSLAVVRRGSSR
ncbi:MAG: PEP-CTERM sorting domain-containing protein [Pirellulales bacterium]|nr:PEP-CTERM sorting domain-containing protein [Pirellulales bacterium]